MSRIALALSLCSLLPVLPSCGSTTERARSVEKSGFLKDYSMLHDGGEDEPLLVYLDDSANWKGYHSIIIEPVVVWMEGDSQLDDVPQEDVGRLAKLLHDLVTAEAAKILKIDKDPVQLKIEGVLRLRIALTEARAGNPVNVVTNTLPIVGTGARLATGTHLFVGKASIEAELLDDKSGKRVGAMVDRRAGTKSLGRNPFSSWGDVEENFKYWSERFGKRIQSWRGLSAE